MDELEEIRKKKLEQLQREALLEQMSEREKEDFEAKKQIILRRILEPAAKERLARIKIARPLIGEQIENQLIGLAGSGKINSRISDEEFKRLLYRIMPKKREIRIRRK